MRNGGSKLGAPANIDVGKLRNGAKGRLGTLADGADIQVMSYYSTRPKAPAKRSSSLRCSCTLSTRVWKTKLGVELMSAAQAASNHPSR
jgi:hypothetical protein